jgi:hypothetical protein
VFVPTDVTDERSVQAAVDRALRARSAARRGQLRRDRHPGRVVGKNGPLPLEAFAASSP